MIKENLKGKKFVASYSGGKDSILAIYRAIKYGLEPVLLITTYDQENDLSWFHKIPKNLLNDVSNSLNIPILIIETSGEEYAENFEKGLEKAKKLGAEVCVFGDIDLEEHRKWCTKRCINTNLQAFFPLWEEDRESLVYEFLESGFIANISIINTKMLDDKFLGNILTKEICEQIKQEGADICGENGEYHTFVSDGPIFKNKIKFSFGKKIKSNGYSILHIKQQN